MNHRVTVRTDDRQLRKPDSAPVPTGAAKRYLVVHVRIVLPKDPVSALKIEGATRDFASEALSALKDGEDLLAPHPSLALSMHDQPLLLFALQRLNVLEGLVTEACITRARNESRNIREISEPPVLPKKG